VPDPALDLDHTHRIHLIGAGGAGMSAVATVLSAMGHRVTGSDLKASAALDRLRSLGMHVVVGHDAAHVRGADVVVASTAVPASNPEVVEAQRLAIPVLRRAQALAAITATRSTVAVAGTHGKTTTSSMLALILVEAGLRPSFIIGGDITEIGSGAAWGDGEWLVVEADESDGTFLELDRRVAVVTSVEADHLDHYGSLSAVEDAFTTFLEGTCGARVTCADEPGAARLGRAAGAVSYGTSDAAGYRMVDVRTDRAGSRFDVVHERRRLGRIDLPVPGLHNARNACGALVAALAVGAPFEAAERALARYAGVARRFEFRGERAGVSYVDDYAHLPGEVRAAVAAARNGGWRRLVVVFQPHRYSRTAALWQAFGDSFTGADLVVITDVYSAGEAPRPGVNGRLIVAAISDADPDAAAVYLPDHAELVAYLRRQLRAGDLCLTLGAGDLTLLPDELLDEPS
jgi:UDP-N-acetylmuramate--alanine ligase